MKRKSVWGNAGVFLIILVLCVGCNKSGANDVPSVEPFEIVTSATTTNTPVETTTEETTETPTTEATTTEEITTAEENTAAQETVTEESTTVEDASTVEEVSSTEGTSDETTIVETPADVTEETTAEPVLTEAERHALMRQLISEALPGIVCWGDSLTYGYGGNGESYPATLSRLISDRIIDGIAVENNGLCIETTHTIMARAGAWAIYAEAFTIPAGTETVNMRAFFEGGAYSNLASNGDVGLNPVTICGIQGELKAQNDTGDYWFHRLEPGEETYVNYGELIHPVSKGLYSGYINIIFMGQNGCYTSIDDLIAQYDRFVSIRSGRYLIIGLTTGKNENRSELAARMSEHFGSNYIDMRVELIQKAPELVGLERREEDINCYEEGRVQSYLMFDDVHLNEYGYRAMGMIVYERLEQLGYFNEVKDIVAKYN